MATQTIHENVATGAVGRLIDRFMPRADISERHETLVWAPADVVFEVARNFDLQSIPLIRAIFWLRAKMLGAATPPASLFSKGLVAETTAMGWGILAERRWRELVVGSVTRPWEAEVVFTPVAPYRFASFSDPGIVKIAWTLEAEPIGPALTLFRTETRVLATDDAARTRFRRYWRWARVGIIAIRWLLLPALRWEAEQRYEAGSTHHRSARGQRKPGSTSSPSSASVELRRDSVPSAR